MWLIRVTLAGTLIGSSPEDASNPHVLQHNQYFPAAGPRPLCFFPLLPGKREIVWGAVGDRVEVGGRV